MGLEVLILVEKSIIPCNYIQSDGENTHSLQDTRITEKSKKGAAQISCDTTS